MILYIDYAKEDTRLIQPFLTGMKVYCDRTHINLYTPDTFINGPGTIAERYSTLFRQTQFYIVFVDNDLFLDERWEQRFKLVQYWKTPILPILLKPSILDGTVFERITFINSNNGGLPEKTVIEHRARAGVWNKITEEVLSYVRTIKQ